MRAFRWAEAVPAGCNCTAEADAASAERGRHPAAARALATAYSNLSVLGSEGVATDAEGRANHDDADTKDSVMRQIYGGNSPSP